MTRQQAGTPAGRWLEEIRQARGSLYTRCCAESEAVLRQWAEAMNQLPMRTQEVSLIAVYARACCMIRMLWIPVLSGGC